MKRKVVKRKQFVMRKENKRETLLTLLFWKPERKERKEDHLKIYLSFQYCFSIDRWEKLKSSSLAFPKQLEPSRNSKQLRRETREGVKNARCQCRQSEGRLQLNSCARLKGHLLKKKKRKKRKCKVDRPQFEMRRHARFHAPKDGVFVTCRHLACKPGVFCGANHDHTFSGLILSRHLGR